MKSWKIPVSWRMIGTVTVEADTLAEATSFVQKKMDALPFPTDVEYVEGTLEIDCSDDEVIRELYNNNQPDEGGTGMISMDDFDRIVDAAENVEWYMSWGKKLAANKKHKIEFGYSSPAGEDFEIVVEAASLKELADEVEEYFYAFNADEHAVEWFGRNNGEPSSLRELLDDAEAIKCAIGELKEALGNL